MDPERALLASLECLRAHYGNYRFFAERGVVWTLQENLCPRLAEERALHLVFNDFPMLKGSGRSLSADLAVVDANGIVALAAEFKYEPDHGRGGVRGEIWPTKLDPSVVFWGPQGVQKDVQRSP